MPKIRVLLADDHETVREGLRLILASQGDMEVVGEAADGVVAVQRARELRPDVVVMDVSMPRLNGLKATEQLTASCPEVKVLALTRHAHNGYLQELLQAGVAGYVLKQSQPAELVAGVRAVAAGGKYLDPAIAGRVIRDSDRHQKPPRGQAAVLSEREEVVLRLMALGHSNKDIAGQLNLSVKTVESHKANAMQKLDLRTRIDVVQFAIMKGWLSEG